MTSIITPDLNTLLLDKLHDLNQRIERYHAVMPMLQPMVDELTQKLGDALISVSPEYSLDISVSGNKDTLATVFRVLTKHGYELPSSRPGPNDPTYHAFWYHNTLNAPSIWLYFTSTVCKRVQVGEETVTETRPIYEVVCE